MVEYRKNVRTLRGLLCASIVAVLAASSQGMSTVDSDYSLSADEDWRSDGTLTVSAVLDLAGNKLYVSGLDGSGTITDTVGGGELHVDVAQGATLVNSTVLLAGSLRLVKEGAGVFVPARKEQSYTGGTEIAAGTLRVVEYAAQHTLGQHGGMNILVGPNGTLDFNNTYDWGDLADITLAGGTVANYGDDQVNYFWGGVGVDTLTADSRCIVGSSMVWSGGGCYLGGDKTLSVTVADGKYFHLGNPPLTWGTVAFADNGAGNDGIFHVCYDNESGINGGSFDVSCSIQLDANLHAANFTYRKNTACGLSDADKKVMVYGRFTPESDYFPNVDMRIPSEYNSWLDLSGKSAAWPIESLDGPAGTTDNYRLSFQDNSTTVIDVGSRALSVGDKIVSWRTVPENIMGLSFVTHKEGSYAGATVKYDGIYYGVDSSDSTVTKAVWNGSTDGDVANAANWDCYNAQGDKQWGGEVPGPATIVFVEGSVNVQIPASTGLSCGTVLLGDCELTDDCDWRGLAELNVPEYGATVDLKGNALILRDFSGIGAIVDSVGGGELHVEVAQGATLENASVSLAGGLRFFKEGEGTFIASKGGQSYSGGTEVSAGVLRAGISETLRPFGARSSVINVGGGVFDDGGKSFMSVYSFAEDGGTVVLSATGSVASPAFADFALNGRAVRISASEIQITPAEGSQVGSAFWNRRVNPSLPWRARFTYSTVNPSDPADGFAFILHNDPRGTSAIGNAGGNRAFDGITPSFGCAYNVFNDDSVTFIDNGVPDWADTSAISGISLCDGVDVTVEYDGNGWMRQTIVQKDGETERRATLFRAVDLGVRLGSSAWIGFTGATGGYICDQRISNFTFEHTAEAGFEFPIVQNLWTDSFAWQQNSAYILDADHEENVLGFRAIRLTPDYKWQRGTICFLTPFALDRTLKVSGTYRMSGSENSGGYGPGDGAAFVFHNDDPTGIGGYGSAYAISSDDGVYPTAVGWVLNVYLNRVEFFRDGVKNREYEFGDSGINLKLTDPVKFTITSSDGMMTLDLTQEQEVDGETVVRAFSAEYEIDLAEYFGKGTAYFTMGGAAAEASAGQWVYDLSYSYGVDASSTAAGAGSVSVTGQSALQVVLSAPDTVAVSELEIEDGATLAVSASGAADADYEMAIGLLRVVSAAGGTGSMSISLAANGSGAGTLRVGSIAFDSAEETLTVSADAMAKIGSDPITVELPRFTGTHRILDMRGAPGLVEEDFAVVSPQTRNPQLRVRGGVLYATGGGGLAIMIR